MACTRGAACSVTRAVQSGDVIGFYGQGIPLDLAGTDVVALPGSRSARNGPVRRRWRRLPAHSRRARTRSRATVLPPGGSASGGARRPTRRSARTAPSPASRSRTRAAATRPRPSTITRRRAPGRPRMRSSRRPARSPPSRSTRAVAATPPRPSRSAAAVRRRTRPRIALGGVDAVDVSVPGAGYTFPTVDFDLPDDPNGVQAQGHATCAQRRLPDCNPASTRAS